MADGQADPTSGGCVTSHEKDTLDRATTQPRATDDDKRRQFHVRSPGQERSSSSRSIDDTEPVDNKSREQRGFRRWWNKLSGMGKAFAVVIGAIASVLGILTALGFIGGSSSPSQLPGYVVLRQPDLLVQKAPNLYAPSVGSLPYDTTVHIVCTKNGDPVTGPGNDGRTTTSRLWDYVQSSASPPGFVPDVWVDTGTTKPEARSC
jgi:hypothetical protein